MIASRKNWYSLLWLTSFLVTGGAWTYLGNYAFAQNAGMITINTELLTITDGTSISDRNGVDSRGGSLNPSGNLTVTAAPVVLTNLGGTGSIGNGTLLISSNSGGNAGIITINTDSLTNGVISSGASLNLGGNLTIRADNLVLTDSNIDRQTSGDSTSTNAGGNINLNAGSIIIRRVPEPSSTLGFLAFVFVSAASIYKFKQKRKLAL